jgi:prolyl 4-hydroxylase
MAFDGSPNPWTQHSGQPVEAGTKYIVTKWFRERPFV